MISYTDLKKGILILIEGEPYEVLESSFSRMQQRKAVVQGKIRNLITGKIIDRSFQASDQYDEAIIERKILAFLYGHRGEYVFIDPTNKQQRFSVAEGIIGDKGQWLKPNIEVTALFFDDRLISFTLPIKMDFKVIEAPPGIQGDRSKSGNKGVTIETNTIVQAPLFINTGDIIRINTETGEYVERVEKGAA